MKRIIFTGLAGLLAVVTVALGQTTGGTTGTTTSGTTGQTTDGTTGQTADGTMDGTAGFAPFNFSNMLLTSTPANATGNSGVSNVFSSSGTEFTFGTGGRLVNPMQFNYVVTGPNTATLSSPATDKNLATTTNLIFTSANGGTYTTVNGENTTTGAFGLSAIPGSAPIDNVSARTTITNTSTTVVGFVIGGAMPRRVLIRAVGPGLAAFGVANPLTDPVLSLYRGNQLLATNDNWGTLIPVNTAQGGGMSGGAISGGAASGTDSAGKNSASSSTSSTTGTSTASTSTSGTSASATNSDSTFSTGKLATGASFSTQLATAQDFTTAGAFSLVPGSKDAAFVATLPPGAYTVLVAASTATVSTSSGVTGATTSGTLSSGVTSGTSTSSVPSTESGTTTSSGTASTGSTSNSGGSTGTGSTSSTTSTSPASGDVLLEVYFLQ